MRTWGFVLFLAACPAAFSAKPASKSKPLNAEQRAAQAIMKSMTLRDEVAQLIIGVCYGDAPSAKSPEYQKYRHWVLDLHIGGFIVNNRTQGGIVRNAEPHAMALFLNQMQRLSKLPLIVGADFERGSSMRVNAGPRFPYNMAFAAARDVEGSKFEGLVTAQQARALGVQWVFAPVADVNNNPENPVINIRSFGENPDEVSAHVTAFIDGAHSADPKNRVILSAKHFPGHGDTNVDSHLGLARLGASRERMSQVELKPFEAALEHQVDSVMTAHLAVPAVEPEDIPATASPKVLTGLLRNELGFSGIIVTDAMDMQGFAMQFNSSEGSVRALEAGADVLLMPPNPEAAIRGIMAAIKSGRLSKKRVEESVLRVMTAKVRVGITKKRMVDLDHVSDVLESPEQEERVQQIADRAVTLLRNDSKVLPLSPANQSCLVITTGARLSQFGQRLSAEFRERAPNTRVTILDPSLREAAQAVTGDTTKCSTVVIAIFGTGGMMSPDIATFLDQLTAGPRPTVVVAMGSPYILSRFTKATGALTTFNPTIPSEVSAVKALFGEIAISGHSPVTIPGVAKYGDGIPLAATDEHRSTQTKAN